MLNKKLKSTVQKTAKQSNFSLRENIMFQLIQKHGIDAQILQTLEEMSEFQKELIKNRNRNADNRQEILSEYTDLRFMLDQIKMIFNFTDEECRAMDEEKLAKAATNI